MGSIISAQFGLTVVQFIIIFGLVLISQLIMIHKWGVCIPDMVLILTFTIIYESYKFTRNKYKVIRTRFVS